MIAVQEPTSIAGKSAEAVLRELEQQGVVVLSGLIPSEQLRSMQNEFARRLRRLRWNDVEGYQKTERYRHMIQDVLTLDQGFVDLALQPLLVEVIRNYVGPTVELVEAKGWKSLPTKRDFHGWHGDAWYDQRRIQDSIPREVKVALYLTDVKSGAFNYIKGSHRKQAPRGVKTHELVDVPAAQIANCLGPAGTVILFDTSGIHRQSVPMLEERHAVFLNYHDPSVPLQTEDVAYYRYHPLLLNAAFLGKLTDEDRRLLGFGNQTNYLPGFERIEQHKYFQTVMGFSYGLKLLVGEVSRRVTGKIKRLLGFKRS